MKDMRNLVIASFLNFIFLSAFITAGRIEDQHGEQNYIQDEIAQYILPKGHLLQKKLKKLFQDPKMFNSPRELNKLGFRLSSHYKRGLMVAWHPKARQYMIKKFNNSISYNMQLENYIRRIKGAKALRQFIKNNNIETIIVPKKWLYQLPENFSDPVNGEPSYVLIAERIDILYRNETRKKYSEKIPRKTLRELTAILLNFTGLDSVLDNMPFTKSNKIAFIDTYKWDGHRRIFLKIARKYMRSKDLKYAEKIRRNYY